MRTVLTLASVLAIAAGAACKKDKPAPTIPATALPEETEPQPAEPIIAEPTAGAPIEEEFDEEVTEEIAEDDTISEDFAEPSEGVLAGRTSTAPPRETLYVDPGAREAMPVDEAIAVLSPTKGNKTRGTITFRDTGDGLEVVAEITGLPRGTHAYHVHVFGDCSSPDAESAGPHFNFQGSAFAPAEDIITGNLGELTPRAGGKSFDSQTVPNATLQGRYSIVGRSVVVHAKGNDPEKTPDGGAGKRLACGVIGVAQEPTALPDAPAPTGTPPAPTPTRKE